jgi:hypothetical protein
MARPLGRVRRLLEVPDDEFAKAGFEFKLSIRSANKDVEFKRDAY